MGDFDGEDIDIDVGDEGSDNDGSDVHRVKHVVVTAGTTVLTPIFMESSVISVSSSKLSKALTAAFAAACCR